MRHGGVLLLSPPGDRLARGLAQTLATAGETARLLSPTVLPLIEGRLERRGYEPGASRRLSAAALVRVCAPELLHVFSAVEAAVAAQWRSRTGRPAVLSLDAIPTRQWLMARRGRLGWILAASSAGVTVAMGSPAAAHALQRSLGLPARVIDTAEAYHALYARLRS